MQFGIVLLCIAYILSQFFRSFLAVLAPSLSADIGMSVDDLALASGLWFLAFSLMQIPVGEALDRIGPKVTAVTLFLFGAGGGALLFALATAPWHISLAMLLIGIGCSPVLMSSYYIFSREYPPAAFATLASIMIGVGSVGNLAGSSPLSMLVGVIGWRATMGSLAVSVVVISIGLFLLVKNPKKIETSDQGSFIDLLKLPALWPILPLMLVNYAPAAGLRGLWVGPYLVDTFQADTAAVGRATLVMSIAMIVGTFAYGPLDRIFGTRKWVIIGGNALGFLCLVVLYLMVDISFWTAVGLFSAVAFFGMSYPMMVAHGKSFAPLHLSGRGVTLMNLFAIGGVGIMQVVTGRIHQMSEGAGLSGAAVYSPLFLFYATIMGLGVIIYVFAQDRMN